jgi:hypothetical protein
MEKGSFGFGWLARVGIVMLVASLAPVGAGAADAAKGSVVYKGRTTELSHVYLVKGEDSMSQVIRELVFSPTDLGDKIQGCTTLSCVSGALNEGMTVDFDAGPRLNFWVVQNGQRVQYSGTADPSTFKASANEPGHIAGTLAIDDTSAGGGKVDVTFDASLVKEFKDAR